MPASNEHKHYVAYLVRIWKEVGLERDQWRASIEDPSTGERRGFANVEELFAFLRDQMNASEKSAGEADA